jgi:hypothetical protein
MKKCFFEVTIDWVAAGGKTLQPDWQKGKSAGKATSSVVAVVQFILVTHRQ